MDVAVPANCWACPRARFRSQQVEYRADAERRSNASRSAPPYEMGSIFQNLPAAMALDAPLLSSPAAYDAIHPNHLGASPKNHFKPIHDYHDPIVGSAYGDRRIIPRNNRAAARMGNGCRGGRAFSRIFFFSRPGSDWLRRAPTFENFPRSSADGAFAVARGVSTMTVAFGHGISVIRYRLRTGRERRRQRRYPAPGDDRQAAGGLHARAQQ